MMTDADAIEAAASDKPPRYDIRGALGAIFVPLGLKNARGAVDLTALAREVGVTVGALYAAHHKGRLSQDILDGLDAFHARLTGRPFTAEEAASLGRGDEKLTRLARELNRRTPLYGMLARIFMPLGFVTAHGLLDIHALAAAAGYESHALYVAIGAGTMTIRLARRLTALHQRLTGDPIDADTLSRFVLWSGAMDDVEDAPAPPPVVDNRVRDALLAVFGPLGFQRPDGDLDVQGLAAALGYQTSSIYSSFHRGRVSPRFVRALLALHVARTGIELPVETFAAFLI